MPYRQMSKQEYETEIAAAEERGRVSALDAARGTAAAQGRVEGATAERERLAAIDENTMPGYEAFAASCKQDGSSAEQFVMRQNKLVMQQRGVAGPQASASGQSADPDRVFSAAEVREHIAAAKAEGRRIDPATAVAELRLGHAGQAAASAKVAAAQDAKQASFAQDEEVRTNALVIRSYIASEKALGRRVDTVKAVEELQRLGRLKRG